MRDMPRRIVFTAFKGVSLLDITGPLTAFRIAERVAQAGQQPLRYECTIVSVRGGLVETADGIDITAQPVRTLAAGRIDTLVVPGVLTLEDVTRDQALIKWVRKRARACRRVCSVCAGSFLLAAAGMLDGRRVATHWMYTDLLADQYPRVTVEADAIFVHDGNVWTSAGMTTGIDLALALIEEDAGREVALSVARILVVYLKRAGGQSQYSALLAAQEHSESDRFGDLERWIAEHLNADLQVETLARRVHMSPRHFARLYARTRGRTPAKAVEAIRVDAARRRLEESADRIEAIAEECGFSGEEQMRVAFVRLLRIAPRDYRKRFGSAT
jgi:transcriptional regulator GlxA family with amidase domain